MKALAVDISTVDNENHSPPFLQIKNQVHIDEKKLLNDHHIYGIKLDKYLCQKLNLNTEER